jgi:hypothetical protein
MPLFGKKSPQTSNNNNTNFLYETEDRRSPAKDRKHFFSSGSADKKGEKQREKPSLQQQALMYGMNLKDKRDQDIEERQAIEKKMAKQNGRKAHSSRSRSKTDDAKSAFKIVNFIRKHK